MSPVFRHGRLRLYLLKLLDEAPRHGYEVIRLLQDRFLGVYAPSPGTIYPRLARLEEEGLVTHDEADGKKVYRITDKGREELRARLDDITELEEEITASVRDIAREVSEDVRETVRSLREELASAARDIHRRAYGPGGEDTGEQQQPDDEASGRGGGWGRGSWRRGGRSWDWGDWGGDWGDWENWGDWSERGRRRGEPSEGSQRGERDRGQRGERDQQSPGAPGEPGQQRGPRAHARYHRDLERLAKQFAREIRHAAWQAQTVSEEALGELRIILDETLTRIKADVFTEKPGGRSSGADRETSGGPEPGTSRDSSAAQGASATRTQKDGA